MGLIDFLLSNENTNNTNNNKKDDKKKNKNETFIGDSEYSEEEMDGYGLTEDEKEEVRKGNFAPWSFKKDHDDEIGEDDYYHDTEK